MKPAWHIAEIAVFSLLLAACATATYQPADLAGGSSRDGYANRETTPGVHVLEYMQYRGRDYDLERHTQYWNRRAVELCPFGFNGGFEVIDPANAKIEEFNCSEDRCRRYALVSGVIRCIEAT